jgi:hypothetical protein
MWLSRTALQNVAEVKSVPKEKVKEMHSLSLCLAGKAVFMASSMC